MVKRLFAAYFLLAASFALANDGLDMSIVSKMRQMYGEAVQRGVKVREKMADRILEAKHENDGNTKIGVFKAAESTVRVLEPLPEQMSGEDSPSRMWQPRNRFDGYEPRSEADNYVAGPESEVILYNQELTQEAVDLGMPGRGDLSFVFRRTYHSNLSYDGPLGQGWDFSYNARLVLTSDNSAILYFNGRTKCFIKNGEEWDSAPGNFYQLKNEGTSYCVYSATLARMEFEKSIDQAGSWRLKAIATRHGKYATNRIEMHYAANTDRLDYVVDPLGRKVALCYDKDGRISQISSGVDAVHYKYDGAGNLIEVKGLPVLRSLTEASVPRVCYSYIELGGRHLISTRRVDGESREYSVEYEHGAKVVRVGYCVPDGQDARWTFESGADGVAVKPPAPSAVVNYVYDKSLSVQDLPRYYLIPSWGATNEFAYSKSGLMVFARDAIGCVKQYRYDEGNGSPCARKNMLSLSTFPNAGRGSSPIEKIEHLIVYGQGTSFPVDDRVIEIGADGRKKVLSVSKYKYNEDWEVSEADENGVKSQTFYNRFGNAVVRINGVGSADVLKYADGVECFAESYKFDAGSVIGGGPASSIVEDATDAQIEQALRAVGKRYFRHSLRVSPTARETFFSYDRYGNPVGVKRNGRISLELRNREGSLLASYAPQKGIQIFGYSASGTKAYVMREIGESVKGYSAGLTNCCFQGRYVLDKIERDSLGMISEFVTDASSIGGHSIQFSYNHYPNGCLKKIVNPIGVVRDDVYDFDTGLLKSQAISNRGLKQSLSSGLVYDTRGELLEMIDPLGEKTRFGYDAFGRRTFAVSADGTTRKTSFDGLDRTISEIAIHGDKEISRTDFEYGIYGKKATVYAYRINENARERIVAARYRYDAAGQVSAECGMMERAWTYYLVDGLGRTVATMLPTDEFRFVIYDGDDVFASATWPCSSGKVDNRGITEGKVVVHDGEGNAVMSVPLDSDWEPVLALGTRSRFDCGGNLVSMESTGQLAKSLTYDTFGRIVSEVTRPASDKYGEETRRTDYEYLPDGQLKRKIVHNDALLVRNVDGEIQPSRVEAAQILEYEYDAIGRSVSICQPDGLVVNRKYDDRSLPIEMTWTHLTNPTNVLRKLSLSFGLLGRLSEIRNGVDGKTLHKYEYDAYGNRVKAIDLCGQSAVVLTRKFDSFGMTSEEVSSRGFRFPVRYDEDLVRGKRVVDLDAVFSQNWVRDVADSNWRRQEETLDSRGRIEEIRLAQRKEPFMAAPFASWGYRGGSVIERSVPYSGLKTAYSYDKQGLLIGADVFRKTQQFGKISYLYDDSANLIVEAMSWDESALNKYESAQYFAYSAYRQLVAQNVESHIVAKDQLKTRRDEVVNGGSGSLQAVKTSRMAYDQAENLWVEYSGGAVDKILPNRFDSSALVKMLSSAPVVVGRSALTQSDRRELASNREVTHVSFAGKDMQAEVNVYDRLGCLKSFDGEYWNGVREFPVKWELDYDALGRLSQMRGMLRESVSALKEGEVIACLQFAYDAINRRVWKKVDDKSSSVLADRSEWTVYDANNQILVLAEENEKLRLREQYLWNGGSREIVMASLPEGDAENISSGRAVRYYFQQDRGLNTVCVTKAEGGIVSLVSGASYLGFGKNTTASRVIDVVTSMGGGENPDYCRNAHLDDGKFTSWLDSDGFQYMELKLSENANLARLSIWAEGEFPTNLAVFVSLPGERSISQSIDVTQWYGGAARSGCLVAARDFKHGENGRPIEIPLYGIRGDRVTLIWNGEIGRRLNVREFEVQRKPDNPGSIAYAGQWLDRETGLYYQINRYRLAGSTKFISPDPIGFMDGNNLYAYAKNNPLEWHDPNGEWAHILLGSLAGAALNGGVYALQCWITGEGFSWKEFAIQAAVGAIAGGVAAATFGAVNPFLASHGFNAAANIVITGAASGLTSGFASGTSSSLMHGENVVDALENGAVEGGWGMLGGAVGGGVMSKLGASFLGTIASGAVAGGVVSGVRGTSETYMETGDWSESLSIGLTAAGKGVVGGAAIASAGWGIGRATDRIVPLKGYPSHMTDPRSKGILIKTKTGERTYGGMSAKAGYQRQHIKPLSLGGRDVPSNIEYMRNELHSTNPALGGGPQNAHPGVYVNSKPLGTIFY